MTSATDNNGELVVPEFVFLFIKGTGFNISLCFQVEVSSCCLFFPSQHVRLQEVSMDIPHMLLSSYMRGTLPDMLVVCCPQLTLHSAGHKTPTMGRMDIPIRTLEQSVAGKKARDNCEAIYMGYVSRGAFPDAHIFDCIDHFFLAE